MKRTKRIDRRTKLMAVALLVLAALYFLPRMITGAMEGYRKGAEIRAQQGG